MQKEIILKTFIKMIHEKFAMLLKIHKSIEIQNKNLTSFLIKNFLLIKLVINDNSNLIRWKKLCCFEIHQNKFPTTESFFTSKFIEITGKIKYELIL